MPSSSMGLFIELELLQKEAPNIQPTMLASEVFAALQLPVPGPIELRGYDTLLFLQGN